MTLSSTGPCCHARALHSSLDAASALCHAMPIPAMPIPAMPIPALALELHF